jgi:hypothetical protein
MDISAQVDPKLVRVIKDGVVTDVHPDALQEHKHLGWVEAPDEPDSDLERKYKR